MEKDIINAFPRKRLFIDTLTQDVKAETCILDLIDNSVDSYIRNKIAEKKEIKLTINKDKFEIFDTCGGIDKDFLKTNVFRFGAENINRDDPTLGMYGIGLKRSIFKMGNIITLETDDGKDYSLMELNVESWEGQDEHDWTIPFETDKTNLNKGESQYTRICIEKLHDDISEKFALVSFNREILTALQRVYCLMKDKIDFDYNGEKIAPYPLIVPYDEKYTPSVHIESYNGIEIQIICFIDPSKGTRLTDAVNIRGWNLFCNNRLILANDTSSITGWIGFEDNKKSFSDKSVLPKYHPIFNEFRGIVFLKANNPFNLPLTTTKDRLKTEDKAYHYILDKMISTARPVIDYLNKKYQKEKEEEDKIEEIIEQTIDEDFNPTSTIEANKINEPSNFSAPKKESIKKDETARISYSRKKKLVEKVKLYMEVDSYKEVGERTFDYFVDREDITND